MNETLLTIAFSTRNPPPRITVTVEELALAAAVNDWMAYGLCHETDPEVFFEQGHDTRPGWERQAKRICAGCPVRQECLDYALEHEEPFGVWGGLTEAERSVLRDRQIAA